MQTEARSPAAAGQKKTKPHPKTIGFNAASNKGDERVAFVANALVGHKVEVQTVSGTVYEGILHSLQARNKQPTVVLYHAKPIKGPEASAQARPVKELVIKPEDLVQILAAGVDLSPEALAGPTNGAAAFGTDSEISRGRGGVERELKKWEPEGPLANLSLDMAAGKGAKGGHWDQFEVNKRMFKVKSTWDENLYTTKLDPKKVGISANEADRLAREIENSSASNRHLAEERNQNSRNTGEEIDEEELYSSVARGNEHDAGYEEDSSKIDAANDATFGGGEDGAMEALDGDPSGDGKGAWGIAGGGVAAVKGVNKVPELERPGKVRTAPIEVDHRKEVNSIRGHLTAGTSKSKDRSSPSSYGTPKGFRSPLSSPLVGNAAQLQGLNLDPGQPHIDTSIRKEFAEFKAKSAQKSERSLSHGLPGSAGSSFKGSDNPLSPGESMQPESGLSGGPSAPKRSFSFSSETSSAAQQPPPPSITPSLTPGSVNSKPGSGVPPKPLTSKLNPNAKSFSFNPNAKEFKPTPSTVTTPAGTPFATPGATPPATPGGASVSSMSGVGGFRSSSMGSGHFGAPSQWLASRAQASPAGHPGRRSEHGARMGEREHGRSRDSEASRHSSTSWHRDRSSDSGFRSEGPSRYPSGPLAPMGSSGLPLSPSQGPMPGNMPVHPMGAQWVQQAYGPPGQQYMPMMAPGHGSPQQGQLLPFPRPGSAGPPGHMPVPVRPGQMPTGMQFMPGNVMFMPPPGPMHGNPGMQSSPGGPRGQMYHPAMLQQGGPCMPLMPMGGPVGPGAPHMDSHMGGSAHSSPEERSRNSYHGQNQHRP